MKKLNLMFMSLLMAGMGMAFALCARAQETPSYKHVINVGIGLWAPLGNQYTGYYDAMQYEEKRHNSPMCHLPVYDESPLESGRFSQSVAL